MASSDEEIALIKGMLAYRKGKDFGFRQQEIAGHFKINSARVTEIRYGDNGAGVGIEPAPESKFPEECWGWSLVRIDSKDRRAVKKLRERKQRKLRKNGGIDLEDINRKIKPIIRALKEQSEKDMATVSFPAIARSAGLLANYLEEWNNPPKKSKGDRA